MAQGLTTKGNVLPQTARKQLRRLVEKRAFIKEIERIEKEVLLLHPLGSREDKEMIERSNAKVVPIASKRNPPAS